LSCKVAEACAQLHCSGVCRQPDLRIHRRSTMAPPWPHHAIPSCCFQWQALGRCTIWFLQQCKARRQIDPTGKQKKNRLNVWQLSTSWTCPTACGHSCPRLHHHDRPTHRPQTSGSGSRFEDEALIDDPLRLLITAKSTWSLFVTSSADARQDRR